jgi:hypothetical protein
VSKPSYEIVVVEKKEYIHQKRFPYLVAHLLYIDKPLTNWIAFNISKEYHVVQIAGYQIFVVRDTKWISLAPRAPLTVSDELAAMASWYLTEVIGRDLKKYEPFLL